MLCNSKGSVTREDEFVRSSNADTEMDVDIDADVDVDDERLERRFEMNDLGILERF